MFGLVHIIVKIRKPFDSRTLSAISSAVGHRLPMLIIRSRSK